MEKRLLICTKILEAIVIQLITFLFTKTLLNIVKNTTNSSNIILFFNEKLQVYFYSTIQTIQNTYYFIPHKIFS